MKSVSILACNNGLGHIKRACILNTYLLEKGVDVKLYGNKQKIDFYTDSKNISKFQNVININNLPDASAYRNYSENSTNEESASHPAPLLLVKKGASSVDPSGKSGGPMSLWSHSKHLRQINDLCK